jgi:hypothetical protein
MFDGMADGKSEAAGQFFQMKTDPYGSVEQLSGSEGPTRLSDPLRRSADPRRFCPFQASTIPAWPDVDVKVMSEFGIT